MNARRAQASRREAPPKRGTLFVCGLGIDRPNDTTLGTVGTLKNCAVAFYMHGDGKLLEPFLKTFCPDVRLFGGGEFDALPDEKRIEIVAAAVCAELSRGKDVAYVTYGHPTLFSDGFNVLQACRANGYAGRVLTAPSAVDSILSAALDLVDALSGGFLVCKADRVLERKNFLKTDFPAILLCLDQVVAGGKYGVFCDRLEAAYPRGHRVFGVKCGDNHGEAVRLSGRVDQLRRWEGKIVHMMSLVLPASRGRP